MKIKTRSSPKRSFLERSCCFSMNPHLGLPAQCAATAVGQTLVWSTHSWLVQHVGTQQVQATHMGCWKHQRTWNFWCNQVARINAKAWLKWLAKTQRAAVPTQRKVSQLGTWEFVATIPSHLWLRQVSVSNASRNNHTYSSLQSQVNQPGNIEDVFSICRSKLRQNFAPWHVLASVAIRLFWHGDMVGVLQAWCFG